MDNNLIPITDAENICITHKYDGYDTLSFDVDTDSNQYSKILEESVIDCNKNSYLVKKISDNHFDCELNFDFLKSSAYFNYKSETRTLSEVLRQHLPNNWQIVNANLSIIRRTIEFEFATDYDIINQCLATYNVSFVWEILNKTVTVIMSEYMQPTGEYLTDQLNLRSVTYKGETTGFITRLYAYGKDGLSFADINDGKEYVDNHAYSDKIICACWKDDRYEIKENLLADAQKKLEQLAYPVRSYECDVIDLAKLNPTYDFLDFAVHKVVTLIDRERKTKINHTIVEYKEYPETPENNIVTLSKVPDKIEVVIKQVASELQESIETETTVLNEAITHATELITSVTGGYVVKIDGELYIMDTTDPDTAQKVWRWNLAGLGYSATGINGPYSTAITADGQIVADFISTGTLNGNLLEANSVNALAISQGFKSSVTNEIDNAISEVSQAFTVADAQLNSTIEAKITENDQKTQEQISSLTQTVDNLTLSFSNAYSGGMNCVLNSSGLNGISDPWIYDGVTEALQNDDTKNNTISGSCFCVSGGTLSQEISVLPNAEYTLSFRLKKSAVRGWVKILSSGSEITAINNNTQSGWKDYTITFAPLGNQITLEIYSYAPTLYIADIMLSEGNIKQRWTPAPNEIYTTDVKIDKNGINITNTQSETQTKINNVEFAVLHKDEKVISVNKDTTVLKKTNIQDELTVGKLRFTTRSDGGVDLVLLD